PTTFRSSVDLVTLEVAVVDRSGKPVVGLSPEDFVVTLDGQTRPVRALNYREVGRDVVSSAAAPAAMAVPAGPAANHRSILILFDDLSARPGDMIGLRVAAERMLPSLDANDRVGVTTTSGLGPNLPPTTDRAALARALSSKELVGRWANDQINV